MKNNEKRTSVAIMISLLFISIVVLFTMSSALSYFRLNEFQSVLSQITKNSIPNILRSEKINNKINELTFLTESLINASSDAGHRIAYKKIETRLNEIEHVITSKKIDTSIENQLNGLIIEVSLLNVLVEQRLILKKNLTDKTQQMYHLYEQLLMSSKYNVEKTASAIVDQHNTHSWALKYSELIIISEKSLTINRLQYVRQIEKLAKKGLIELTQYIEYLPLAKQSLTKELTLKLSKVLTGINGLFALRIEQLRLIGRVRGRGNFVKNVADDFARIADFQLYKTNKKIINETEFTAKRISSQTTLIVILSIVVFILLFGVVFFIKNRFVERLLDLNTKILARLSGENVSLNIKGNDEISDIAKSFSYFANKIEEQKEVLQQLSLTDGLTGLSNRRALDARLLHELNIAKRNCWSVSILLMDVDNFKLFNDNYGHIAGDDCLQKIASVLMNSKQRTGDFIARYGGEEFTVVLPNTNSEGAEEVAQSILTTINEMQLPHHYSETADHVTLSIGVATFQYNDNVQAGELIHKADKALYKAKSHGKNCVFTI